MKATGEGVKEVFLPSLAGCKPQLRHVDVANSILENDIRACSCWPWFMFKEFEAQNFFIRWGGGISLRWNLVLQRGRFDRIQTQHFNSEFEVSKHKLNAGETREHAHEALSRTLESGPILSHCAVYFCVLWCGIDPIKSSSLMETARERLLQLH